MRSEVGSFCFNDGQTERDGNTSSHYTLYWWKLSNFVKSPISPFSTSRELIQSGRRPESLVSPENERVHVDDDHVPLLSPEDDAAGAVGVAHVGVLDEARPVRLRDLLVTLERLDGGKVRSASQAA